MYPQSVLSINFKNIKIFIMKFSIFTLLHGQVFVMKDSFCYFLKSEKNGIFVNPQTSENLTVKSLLNAFCQMKRVQNSNFLVLQSLYLS